MRIRDGTVRAAANWRVLVEFEYLFDHKSDPPLTGQKIQSIPAIRVNSLAFSTQGLSAQPSIIGSYSRLINNERKR